MDNVCGVDVFESPKDLVNEVLYMIDGEFLLGINDSVEIGLHQVCHYIDVVEVFEVSCDRRHHVDNVNDILVLEVFQQLDFS
jgi:hypothetical protein